MIIWNHHWGLRRLRNISWTCLYNAHFEKYVGIPHVYLDLSRTGVLILQHRQNPVKLQLLVAKTCPWLIMGQIREGTSQETVWGTPAAKKYQLKMPVQSAFWEICWYSACVSWLRTKKTIFSAPVILAPDEVGFEVHEKLFGHDKPFLAVYSRCHFWPFIRAVIFGRLFTKMRAV